MSGEPQPLWRRAMLARELERCRRRGQGAAARLALVDVLRKAGVQVSLVTVHRWPRAWQGEAYLWAIAFLDGREDLPMPTFIVEGPRVPIGRVVKATPPPRSWEEVLLLISERPRKADRR